MMLIILGMIFIAIGLLGEKGKVEAGFLVLLGPFPIGAGNPHLLLLLMLISLVLMVWWYYVVLG